MGGGGDGGKMVRGSFSSGERDQQEGKEVEEQRILRREPSVWCRKGKTTLSPHAFQRSSNLQSPACVPGSVPVPIAEPPERSSVV